MRKTKLSERNIHLKIGKIFGGDHRFRVEEGDPGCRVLWLRNFFEHRYLILPRCFKCSRDLECEDAIFLPKRLESNFQTSQRNKAEDLFRQYDGTYTSFDNLIPRIVAACPWGVQSGKLVYSSTFRHVPTCVYISHRPNESFVPEQQRK